MQEVVLDKGVKVLDCPGVVLDDFDRMGLALDESEKGKRKGAVLLRNCVKVEEVEDPMAAVEEILRRVEVSKMMELYEVPEYKNVTEFLVRVALTRGRLGKVSKTVYVCSPSSRENDRTDHLIGSGRYPGPHRSCYGDPTRLERRQDSLPYSAAQDPSFGQPYQGDRVGGSRW